MSRAASPLIARLRRRLAATVWLLALVVLIKGTLASLCLADGVATSNLEMSAVATSASDSIANSHADEDAAPCWHAGNVGCHCACMHGLALPTTVTAWAEAPLSGARIAPPEVPSRHLPHPPLLRPPIA